MLDVFRERLENGLALSPALQSSSDRNQATVLKGHPMKKFTAYPPIAVVLSSAICTSIGLLQGCRLLDAAEREANQRMIEARTALLSAENHHAKVVAASEAQSALYMAGCLVEQRALYVASKEHLEDSGKWIEELARLRQTGSKAWLMSDAKADA